MFLCFVAQIHHLIPIKLIYYTKGRPQYLTHLMIEAKAAAVNMLNSSQPLFKTYFFLYCSSVNIYCSHFKLFIFCLHRWGLSHWYIPSA